MRQDARKKNGSVKNTDVRKTVGFAIRIHEGRHSSQEIKSELAKLGLHKKYDGIFYKLDKAGISKFYNELQTRGFVYFNKLSTL